MARSLQPEKRIDDWRDWSAELHSRPVVLGELSGGRSNRSLLLRSNLGKLVLRINGIDSLLPGASRDNEITIWQLASNRGIAPPLLFVDPQCQYLVSTYIEDKLPPEPQLDPSCVEQALALMERCHQLDIKAPAVNYFDHIERYWRIIEAESKSPSPTLIRQREPMHSLLESLLNSNTPTGLCHHDPVTANFVGSPERLYLTDWEYAANGLQIMDYAALATEWNLDDAAILERTRFEPESLIKARTLYRYLCSLGESIKKEKKEKKRGQVHLIYLIK